MTAYTDSALALGSAGRAVTALQSRLGIATTGTFDKATQDALIAAQTHHKLGADGVYGPITNAALTGRSDFWAKTYAQTLDIDPAALAAVVSVETSGAGFYDCGLPKILLERHYVHAYAMPEQRQRLGADVCNPEPGGYLGGIAEWSRFDLVAAVDLGLAIRSCSWGLGQIMGANWRALGYLTPQAFMRAASDHETAQLGQLAQFLHDNPPMLIALRAKRWADFARLYNGPNYAAGRYDAKLAFAYDAARRG
jgi:hypothetical protein